MPRKTMGEEKPAGLYLVGTISTRSKRKVPKDNPQHEAVTYLIKDNNGRNM